MGILRGRKKTGKRKKRRKEKGKKEGKEEGRQGMSYKRKKEETN